jgi:hypothetical protein
VPAGASRGNSKEEGRDESLIAVRVSWRSDLRRPTLKAAIRSRELALVDTLPHEAEDARRELQCGDARGEMDVKRSVNACGAGRGK